MFSLSFHGRKIASKKILFVANKATTTIALKSLDVHRWRPEKPFLYDVRLELEHAGKVGDRVLSYLGLAEIEAEPNGVALNGKRTFLKFVLDQGYFPGSDLTASPSDYEKDIALTKAMGFNGVRKHEKVEPELFNYLADREGLLTTLELPSPHAYDGEENEVIKNQWVRILNEHRGHPSIAALVCYNESWGVEDIRKRKDEQEQANSLVVVASLFFDHVPVISNDGWEHTKSDLLTFHNYDEQGCDFLKTYGTFADLFGSQGNGPANNDHMAFAEGYHYQGQPLFMDEFAGIVLQKDEKKGWGYHSASDEASFLAKYNDQVKGIEKLGFSGYCATQLTDVYQEKNGFLDFERRPKIALSRLKKINDHSTR